MKRSTCILMPVFSLPAEHGIGDFGPTAYQFIDMMSAHGIGYWQILPLNSGNPENGESPYFSVSACALNPLFISLALLEEAGLLSAEEVTALPSLMTGTIRYDDVRKVKTPLLRRAVERFRNEAAFEEFCRLNAFWLDDFALFETMHDFRSSPWNQWPVAERDRDEHQLALCKNRNAQEIHMRKVLQYFAWTQWQNLRRYCTEKHIAVIGDMPIYVAWDSADCWMNAGLFKLDANKHPTAVSGVPPDFFSAAGQLWNNPVYNWNVHKTDGFSWWIGRLRHLFSLYDMVRIDHFRGLVQYWEIPSGEKTAVNGTWVDVPTYDLFDTLITAIKPFPVICEDLGIITDDVRAAMKHYGFPGMKVLQFAFADDDPDNPNLPHTYDGNCLAYTGTHDNLPTLGWLRMVVAEKELARMTRYTGRKSHNREIVWDLIELAMQSDAVIAVFPLQDLLTLDETARINDPARLDGNWQWRWNPARDPAQTAFNRLLHLGRKCRRL